MEKVDINPMRLPMHNAPRCSARSKRSGKRCRGPAVRGKTVCRMHGAQAGAPQGAANGRFIHGNYSQDWQNLQRAMIYLARLAMNTNAIKVGLSEEAVPPGSTSKNSMQKPST